MAEQRSRRNNEPAFVLHAWPYRETSQVVELFCRSAGRIAVVARGSRRPRAALRGVLQSFQPLAVGWFGKGELRTLAGAEWQGGQPRLQGDALLCGFYLNELLLKLLPREDAHERLFDDYRATLRQLADDAGHAPLLRRFELSLMRELGYGLTLEHDADGAAVRIGETYVWHMDRGAVPGVARENEVQLSGRTLLDMARGDYQESVTAAESKQLMRHLINHHLGGQVLYTRRLFRELQQS